MPDRHIDRAVVHRARLASQLLDGPPARSVRGVCEHLLAIQAQDDRGFRLAIRNRSAGLDTAAVDAALNHGDVVVSWLNRGTLHLVRSSDYWWLHQLTTPQMQTGTRRRLDQEHVAPTDAARAIDAIAAAVERVPATRRQLRGVLDAKRIRTEGQALVHLLVAATLEGAIVRGPVIDGEHAFVSPERWLGSRPAPLDRDEALARLADRYLQGHSPATAADLARWAGITLNAARAGLAALGDRTENYGELHSTTPLATTRAARSGRLRPRLLGPFDPVLLGWVSREDVVGSHFGLVTTNGIFRPFPMIDGQAVGTWGLTAKQLTIKLLEDVSAADEQELVADAAAVQQWLRLEARPVRVECVRA